jgi:hypothetical protein
VQIFDEGAHIPLHPITEAIVRAVIALAPELVRQQQGLMLLHYSATDTHLTAYRKNLNAEVRKKVTRRGQARD